MRSQWFIFAFVSVVSRDVLSKKLPRLRSERLLPAFSSRTLMASCLAFRSFIHFEFIFVYGVRKWSRFIFLHVAVQFSQHHLLRRLSLFHWIFVPALSKISWPYVSGSISGFSILFY
uniref:Secreted protein n=1 Tax=Felis catus TaxID=9685 RepID=A0ABI8AN02_FELCA